MEARPRTNNEICPLISESDKCIREAKEFVNNRIDPILWEEERFKPTKASRSLNEDINTVYELRASCNNFQKETDLSTCPSDCVTKSQYQDIVERITRRMVRHRQISFS